MWCTLIQRRSTDSVVLAVGLDSLGSLYAAGWFKNVNDIQANHIAKWNGTTWSTLGDGVDYVEYPGTGFCFLSIDNQENIYIAAHLTSNDFSISKSKPNHIVKWNGTEWSILGGDINPGPVTSLHLDVSGTVYAGSYSKISKWNGNIWDNFGCYGTNGSVHDLVVDSSNNIYAGGIFTIIGKDQTTATGIARWDGKAWTALEDSAEDGNSFTYGGGLTVDKSGIVYAIGNINSPLKLDAIARWDGSAWNEIGSIKQGYFVSCLVDGAGNLYAVGRFLSINNKMVNNIARWNGSEWCSLDNGLRSKSGQIVVNALTFDESGNLYAAGHFDSAGSIAANNIAKWDGSAWSSLGSGINFVYDIPVCALVSDNKGNLYAGGSFDTAGTVSAKNIAKWDGNTWSALGCGIDHVADLDGQTGVLALTVDKSGNLYVGGGFDTIGEVPAYFIARWNGSDWSSLGSGVFGGNLMGMNQSAVFALAVDNANTLYVGGEFLTAGDKVSPYIAKCNLNSTVSKKHSIYPDPSKGVKRQAFWQWVGQSI